MTKHRSTHQDMLFRTAKSQLNVAPGKLWGVKAMIKAASVLFPLAGTASLFFVLYNNTSHGLAILAVLLVPNLAILLIPQKRIPARFGLQGAKLSALCVVSVLGTMLGIETLFPLALPLRFSEVMELSKGFMESPTEERLDQTTVFLNREQRTRSNGLDTQWTGRRVRFWHSPGRRFTYYGYDPNSKQSYANRFRWNSAGYFDHDYDCPRHEGARRVVVIGDSYVEAVQVPLERTFHKIVEKELNGPDADLAPLPKTEVIALGKSGTGQVDHLRVLREEALRYDPDMVVLTLCSNDFCDDDPALSQELVLAAGGVSPEFRGCVSHGYLALAFAVRRLNDIRRNRVAVSPELLQWSKRDIPRVEAAWTRTLGCIEAARDFCHARGIEFVLVYLGADLEVKYAMDPVGTLASLRAMGGPHADIDWDMGKSVRRINSFAEEHDIVLVSLLEPLVDEQQRTGKVVFGDHYTMFGHQVAAGVLARVVNFRLQTYFAARPEIKYSASPGTEGTLPPGAGQTVSSHPEAMKAK
jgi:hypothetical protein